MKKVKVTRDEKLTVIRHLIEVNEYKCALICCHTWQIGYSVYKKLVEEVGSDEAKKSLIE